MQSMADVVLLRIRVGSFPSLQLGFIDVDSEQRFCTKDSMSYIHLDRDHPKCPNHRLTSLLHLLGKQSLFRSAKNLTSQTKSIFYQ